MLAEDFYEKDINITFLSSVRTPARRFVLKTFECHKGWRMFSRLFLVRNGKTRFDFTDSSGVEKTVFAKRGDIVYLPDDAEYRSSWENADEIDYISIEFKLEDEKGEVVLLNDDITVIARDKYNVLDDAFENFFNVYTKGALGYKLKCKALLYDIIMSVTVEHIRTEMGDVYKGILFIENNYTSDISVNELAKLSGMCQTGFRAKFRRLKGMSPIEYRNYLRIKHAAELLRNEDYTVTEAAENVNLPDLCYFSRLFKRYMGVSPRDYRASVTASEGQI